MKTIFMMCFVLLLCGTTSLKAQGVFDKIDKALSKVDKASNTADKTKGTGDKLLGFFSKKKKPKDSTVVVSAPASATNSTIIIFNGIDFSNLKAVSENIQQCKGVQGTSMKYSAAGSTLKVQHEGSSEDLLKLIQKSEAKAIFADKNLQSLEDGKISINLPKKKS